VKKYRVYLECAEIDRKYIDVLAESEDKANFLAEEFHSEDEHSRRWVFMPEFFEREHFIHSTEELTVTVGGAL